MLFRVKSNALLLLESDAPLTRLTIWSIAIKNMGESPTKGLLTFFEKNLFR